MWMKINSKLLIRHFDKYGYIYSGFLSILMNAVLIIKTISNELHFLTSLFLYFFISLYGVEAGYKGYRNNKNYLIFLLCYIIPFLASAIVIVINFLI